MTTFHLLKFVQEPGWSGAVGITTNATTRPGSNPGDLEGGGTAHGVILWIFGSNTDNTKPNG
jgi:hypothetical protein